MNVALYNVIYFLSSMLGIFARYKFVRIFYPEKVFRYKRAEFGMYGVLYIAINLVFWLFNTPILTLSTNIILLFVIAMIMEPRISKAALVSLAVISLLSAVEVCVILLSGIEYLKDMPSMLSESRISVYNFVTVDVLCYIVVLIIEKLKIIKNEGSVPDAYWLAILVIPATSIYYMMTTLLRFETTNIDVAIASITTLASSFLVFTIYDMLGQKYRQQEENTIIRQLNSEHLKHLDLMKDSILKTRRTSHDNNRHLNTLKGLLEAGNSSQALNYLDSILEDKNQNQNLVDSGNQIIDSIVSCEVSMVKNDCEIQLNIGRIPSDIKVQDYDMTIILSNLLENAREAILFVEGNSVLDLRIDYDKGMLLVIVKNSYVLEVKQQDKQFKTHKNTESHGFGLQNVQRVIEKYDGDMEINYDGKSFEVEIVLYC